MIIFVWMWDRFLSLSDWWQILIVFALAIPAIWFLQWMINPWWHLGPVPDSERTDADMDNVFPALIGSGAGAAFALIGKVLWDSYKGGQVERRSAYVTQEECRSTRKGCCIDQVKRDLAADHSKLETLVVRVGSAEKRLDDGREDFKEIRIQIGEINQTLASLASEFRSFFRQFRKEDKE